MYKLEDIREIHFEITSNCQARCPQCPRRINGGPMNPFVSIQEVRFEQFVGFFEKSFIKQLNLFYMCGNLGDPIIAKDTLKIFKYLRETNPSITLKMFTNGSAQNTKWWEELALTNVEVTFAIDGLADTNSLYRVGTDYDKIIENATAFNRARGVSRWDMLVFEHNEHQIEACREASIMHGFREFRIKHTNRFLTEKLHVLNDNGETTHIIKPTEKSISMIPKVIQAQTEQLPSITCKSVEQKSLYISSTGNISPCCWLDLSWYQHNHPSRIDYMDKIGCYPNLFSNTIREVFDSGYFDKIESMWNSCGLRECSKQCGSFNKQKEQYV